MSEHFSIVRVLDKALRDFKSQIHTVVVAKITKINSKTINCKPVVNDIKNGKSIEYPEFIDVNLCVLNGDQNSFIMLPVKVGGYVLLFIAENDVSNWNLGVDFKDPLENRRLDYSDALAFPIANPIVNALDIVKNITINSDGDIDIKSGANVNINGSKVNINSSEINLGGESGGNVLTTNTQFTIPAGAVLVQAQAGVPNPSPITITVSNPSNTTKAK